MHYKAQKRIDAVRSGKTDTLDLSNLGLTELPDEVYKLTNLRELKVFNILLMSHQEMIDLHQKWGKDENDELLNELVEEENELQADLLIPKQLQYIGPNINQLRSLEVLNLWCNRIERLPDSIGTLPKLRRLILRDNALTELPETLAQLPQLELLDIRNNPIRSIPRLPQLEQYENYGAHFHPQKQQALQDKDYGLAVWFRGKETEYGLVK